MYIYNVLDTVTEKVINFKGSKIIRQSVGKDYVICINRCGMCVTYCTRPTPVPFLRESTRHFRKACLRAEI